MLTGISLPEAVAISLVASAVQNCTAAWQLRREIDYRGALRPMLIRFATLPLGVLALCWIGEDNKDVGQPTGRRASCWRSWWCSGRCESSRSPRLHPAWEWLAFGAGRVPAGAVRHGRAADGALGHGPRLADGPRPGLPLLPVRDRHAAAGAVPVAGLRQRRAAGRCCWAWLPRRCCWLGIYLGLALVASEFPTACLRSLATAVLVLIAVSSIAPCRGCGSICRIGRLG